MIGLVIASCILLAIDPSPNTIPLPPVEVDSLIQRALWAEARGLGTERRQVLEQALRADPDNPRAHGLLGQVNDRDHWADPADVARGLGNDPLQADALAEYRAVRKASAATADDHRRLAAWCERHGLVMQAVAHLTAVTSLEPGDESAWRRIGYRRSGGRWVSPKQAQDEAVEAAIQAKADVQWQTRLAAWKAAARDKAGRGAAVRSLDAVRDPRAVPAVLKVFDDGSLWGQSWVVRVLGRIDAPMAAQGLAKLAVLGASEVVRSAAAERLTKEDPRTFVGMLINQIHEPIRYQSRRVGRQGEPGELIIDATSVVVRRVYEVPPTPAPPTPRRGDLADVDAQGRPVLKHREVVSRLLPNGHKGRFVRETTVPVGRVAEDSQRAARAAEKRLEADARAVERENFRIAQINERAVRALVRVTGRDFGRDRQGWTEWWTDQLGYRYQSAAESAPKPEVVQEIRASYAPEPIRVVVVERQIVLRSCFGAGTPVLTRSGLQPIERVEVGDLVLSQDTVTERTSSLPAGRSGPAQPAGSDASGYPRGRGIDNRYENPPVLAARLWMGDGPRPDAGRSSPDHGWDC